jgi:hypothetical protein
MSQDFSKASISLNNSEEPSKNNQTINQFQTNNQFQTTNNQSQDYNPTESRDISPNM